MEIGDTEILDWLEAQNKKAKNGGKCLFRWTKEFGWRLMEMREIEAKAIIGPEGKVFSSVREAIIDAMKK